VNWWTNIGARDFENEVSNIHGMDVVSEVVSVKAGKQEDGAEFLAIRIRSSNANSSVDNMATCYIRPNLSFDQLRNSLHESRSWFADQFAQEQLGIAPPKPHYWLVAVSNPDDPSKRVQGLALCDPSAPQTLIMKDFCDSLGLRVEQGCCQALLRVIGKRFTANVRAADITILAIIGKDLIERVIVEDANQESLESLFLDSAVRAYAARRTAKAKTVLVLGSYGDEGIKRLRFIEGHLSKAGYDPVLVADYPSAPESLEAKVLSFITISKFVIYESTFPSGAIDEFVMCKNTETITAVLHEKDRMATAMQAHYGFGHQFIKFFPYEKETLADVLFEAVKWAEAVVASYEKFYARE